MLQMKLLWEILTNRCSLAPLDVGMVKMMKRAIKQNCREKDDFFIGVVFVFNRSNRLMKASMENMQTYYNKNY